MSVSDVTSTALEKLSDVMLDKASGVFDILLSGVQNSLMEKRIDNAVKTVELIKSRLAEYGVEVDYRKYFSEKLQVPMEWARAVSEVEGEDLRRLLQNLFTRHLMGDYEDDGHYVAFISIIKEMDADDIHTLIKIKAGKGEDYPAKSVNHLFHLGLIDVYHEITVPKTDEEVPSAIDGGDSHTTPAAVKWGLLLGEQKAVQVGTPYMTEYGDEFLEACTSPLGVVPV